MALTAISMIGGCAADADSRPPEEWLSLAYSGLAAMDQYHFAGSVSMGLDEAVMSKPQMFEGKVVDHEQLTIQSDEQTPVNWNPVDVLSKLSEANAGVSIIDEGVTETEAGPTKTLTIRVGEAPTITTKRWEGMLRQQFQEVAGSDIGKANASSNWKQIVEQSRKELDEMLSQLQATSQYEIVIDKQRLLPLKMEENTSFSYSRGGKPVKESRHTTVRFQKFEGAAGDSVQ
jgi:hypothetical protein